MSTPIPPPPFGPPPFGPPPFGPPPLGGQPFGQNPASTPPSSGVAPGAVLSVIGAIAVAVSIFMNWGTDTLFDRSRTANEIPLQILWDTTPATFNSFAVRWPLMLGAILMVSGAFKLRAKGAALVGSILALATALLYVNGIRAVHADPLYDIEGHSPTASGRARGFVSREQSSASSEQSHCFAEHHPETTRSSVRVSPGGPTRQPTTVDRRTL